LYLGLLLKEAGNPTDPLHKMLVWQTAVAHFKIGKLHRDAAQAKDRATAEACCNAALGLTLELRKLVIALADYRERSARTVTPNRNASVDCAATKPAPSSAAVAEAAIVETAVTTKERQGGAPQRGSHGKHEGSPKASNRRAARGNRPTKAGKKGAKCGEERTLAPVGPRGSSPRMVRRPTGAKMEGPRGKKRRPATTDKKSARQLRAELDEMTRWAV
jgi:hypothetical protein